MLPGLVKISKLEKCQQKYSKFQNFQKYSKFQNFQKYSKSKIFKNIQNFYKSQKISESKNFKRSQKFSKYRRSNKEPNDRLFWLIKKAEQEALISKFCTLKPKIQFQFANNSVGCNKAILDWSWHGLQVSIQKFEKKRWHLYENFAKCLKTLLCSKTGTFSQISNLYLV